MSPIPERLLTSLDNAPSSDAIRADLPIEGDVDVVREMVAGVSVGVGRPGDRPAGGDPAWERVAALLRAHGLQGIALSRHAAEPFLPDRIVRELDAGRTSAGLRTTLALEAGDRAREALHSRGVPSLLYKGAALVAGGVYASPGERPMEDVDLLVPPSRRAEAMEALREAGFRPWSVWESGREEWSDAVALSDERSPPGVEITVDLHWRIGYDRLRYGRENGATGGDAEGILWRGSDEKTGLPRDEPHLIVLLEHFVKHLHARPHVLGLADAARLSPRIDDWSEVLSLMDARPAGPALSLVLDVLRVEWGVTSIPPTVATRAGLESWTRRARRSLTPGRLLVLAEDGGHGRLGGLLVRWSLLGSPGRALREVRRTVFPRAPWLRGRYGEQERPLPLLLLRYWSEVARWLVGRGVSPVSPNQEFVE